MTKEQWTPAACAAALAGDVENTIVAMTPGGIEAQEAAGQRMLVQGGRLPKQGTIEPDMHGKTNRQELENLGFVFGAPVDDLFLVVTFPPGWQIRPSDHSMWSHVVDAMGRERIAVFYKAAFYDRSAFCSPASRYRIQQWQASSPGRPETSDSPEFCYVVRDGETALFASSPFGRCDFAQNDRSREECTAWLAEYYPDWKNPFAYWERTGQ